MPATIRIAIRTGPAATPTIASAETGVRWNREDTQSGATPVPIPPVASTEFSFPKWLYVDVTTAATTSLSNRRLQLATAPAAGLTQAFQASGTYAQETAPLPTAATNGAVPTGFTAIGTTAVAYDTAAVVANLGRNGAFARVVAGVSALFTGGAGNATAMPDLWFVVDEA